MHVMLPLCAARGAVSYAPERTELFQRLGSQSAVFPVYGERKDDRDSPKERLVYLSPATNRAASLLQPTASTDHSGKGGGIKFLCLLKLASLNKPNSALS